MFGARMAQDFSELDMQTFMAGFQDSFAGEEGRMTMDEVTQTIQAYQQEQAAAAQLEQEKLAAESIAASATWLTEKEAEDGVMKTESGLLLSKTDAFAFRYKKARVIKTGTEVDNIKEKDIIYYDKAQAHEVIINDVPYVVIQERDVVVVL